MITLYVSGPNFGLPDGSPFVSKLEILLKMAGLPYKTATANFVKAPKGKIPYIDIDGQQMGDSTLIRWYLEKTKGVDFDPGLNEAEKAVAWAFEKMCENHLYWAIVHARWMDNDNFDRGPRALFKAVPRPVKPLVLAMVKRQVRRDLRGQGLGRHALAEVEALGTRDIDAIAAFLGDKEWLMGATPCGADATVWSFVAGVLSPTFQTPLRHAGERHANLVAYRDRGMALWFPLLNVKPGV